MPRHPRKTARRASSRPARRVRRGSRAGAPRAYSPPTRQGRAWEGTAPPRPGTAVPGRRRPSSVPRPWPPGRPQKRYTARSTAAPQCPKVPPLPCKNHKSPEPGHEAGRGYVHRRSVHLIEIGGLPAHILLVHAVVVLAPIAGLGAIVYAVAPRWRSYLAWPLGVLSLGMVPGLAPDGAGRRAVGEEKPGVGLGPRARTAGGRAQGRIRDLLRRRRGNADRHASTRSAGAWDSSAACGRTRVSGWCSWSQGLPLVAFFIYQSIITGHSGAASVWAGR